MYCDLRNHCYLLSHNYLEGFQADLDLLLGTDKEAQPALFILKLKEFRRLSQSAVDDIIHGWNGTFHHPVQQLNARVRETLALSNVDVSSIGGLEHAFSGVHSPFEGLQSQFLQEKYVREKLGLVVSEFRCFCRTILIVLPLHFCVHPSSLPLSPSPSPSLLSLTHTHTHIHNGHIHIL